MGAPALSSRAAQKRNKLSLENRSGVNGAKRQPIRNRVGQAGTAGIKRGGRLSDTRPFTAPPCGGHHSAAGRSSQPKCGMLVTTEKSALVRFDDDPAGIIQTPRWSRLIAAVFDRRLSIARFSLNCMSKLLNIVHREALGSLNSVRRAVNDIKKSDASSRVTSAALDSPARRISRFSPARSCQSQRPADLSSWRCHGRLEFRA